MKKKNGLIAFILCCFGFVGFGGLHDFYIGNYLMGVVKLLTFNFLFIGTIKDLKGIITGQYDSSLYNPLEEFILEKQLEHNRKNPVVKPDSTSTYSELFGMDFSEGSDAQISWAKDLVSKYVENLKYALKTSVEEERISQADADRLEQKILHEILYLDNASWWIDRRYYGFKKLSYTILEDEEELKDIMRNVTEK